MASVDRRPLGTYELQGVVLCSIKGTDCAGAPELLILVIRTRVLGMSIPQKHPFSPASDVMMLRTFFRSWAMSSMEMSTGGRVNDSPDRGHVSSCSAVMIAPRWFCGPRVLNPGGLNGKFAMFVVICLRRDSHLCVFGVWWFLTTRR